MARASAPPWDPTPICRIAVVRAAISPSLSAKSRPPELSHLNGPNIFGVDLLLIIHDAAFRDVGGDFLRFRQRADPLVFIKLFRGWVFVLLQKVSCVLRRNRHSSGKSPVAHLIVRMSSPQNRCLLCLAPPKETMASKCSCRSPVGSGTSSTRGSDAMPVLFLPCSLIALRAALYLPPPQAILAALTLSAAVG